MCILKLPEAYGQTEATCGITSSHPIEPLPGLWLVISAYNSGIINFCFNSGHCGPPLSCCMVKLVDVPDMNYFAKDGKGEVIFVYLNLFIN